MRIAIFGYGNLGRGVELACRQNPDTELVGVFTRRAPETLKTLTGVMAYSANDILSFKDKIDVLIICGGSATDLPVLSPMLAKDFNIIDSFDTHAKIPEHFKNVDDAAKASNHTALISGGWDPGLFSLARIYFNSILPNGNEYTFWGKGVSQGHSDAIRRIPGVIDARQYTIPVESALNAVRNGENKDFTAREKHTRECFVVAAPDANKAEIENAIKTMPNYFSDYDTTVHFITEEELKKNHGELNHAGNVIKSGYNGLNMEHKSTMEFSLKLDSNPEFTALVLVALARAINKHYIRGDYGCKTIFDIAPAELSTLSGEELRKKLL